MEQVKIDTFDLFISNVHLVQAEGKKVLIDICEARRVEQVEAALAKLGLSPRNIDLIVCTHGHADHCGGARHFQERYKIPVALGKGDLEMVKRGKNGSILPYTLTDWLVRKFIAYNDELPPFTPDIVIEEQQDLRARGFAGEAIPVPCHTAGSLAIAFGSAVFVGDLFRGSLFFRNRPKRHFFKPEREGEREQVRRLLDAGYLKFFCGHGKESHAAAVRRFYTL